MWKTIAMVVGLVTLAGAPARGQEPAQRPRTERLRQMIEERFAEQVQRQLALSDEQSAQVRSILAAGAGKRRAIEREERRLRRLLATQMRPGVAADEAALERAITGLVDGRIAYAQALKAEMAELSAVLTTVQQAQYLMLRDRLMQRVQDVRNRRGGAANRDRP